MWPIPVAEILSFIAYLYEQKMAHSTIVSYLSGIGFFCKLNNFEDVTQNFIVKKALEGVRRSRPRAKDSRLPITFDILSSVLEVLPIVCKSSYEAILFKSAFSLAFHGLFRIGEITVNTHRAQHTVMFKNVTIKDSLLSLRLSSSKTDQTGKGVTILIKSLGNDNCPVILLKQFLDIRPCKEGTLFCHFDGSDLTRYQFVSVLKKALSTINIDPDRFSSHSFRIGAATSLSMRGVPDDVIMKLGRWKSQAFRRYIRL